MLYSPKRIQLCFYILIFAFPSFAIFLLYSALSEYLQHNVLSSAYLSVGFLFSSTFTYFGFMYFKFVPAKVDFNDQQFTIYLGKFAISHDWQEIAEVKHYRYAKLLKLIGHYGNTVLVVRVDSTGYLEFIRSVNKQMRL